MQVFGTHDDATRAQLARVAEHARKVALMADGHVGYVMPIGGVAAYDNQVSVVGVDSTSLAGTRRSGPIARWATSAALRRLRPGGWASWQTRSTTP
jgi:hypothetical protein